MLRILHLITCYAGASPQGEAFLKILHSASFEANVTSASFVQREVARLAVTEGLFLLKSSAALPLCVILSGA